MALAFEPRWFGAFLLCVVVAVEVFSGVGAAGAARGRISLSAPFRVSATERRQGLQSWQEQVTAKGQIQSPEGQPCPFLLLSVLPFRLRRRRWLSSRDVLRVCTESWRRLFNAPEDMSAFQTLVDSLVNELGFAGAILGCLCEAGEGQIVAANLRPLGKGVSPLPSPFKSDDLCRSLPASGQVVEGEALKGWLRCLLVGGEAMASSAQNWVGWLAPLTLDHRPVGFLLLIRCHPFSPKEVEALEQLRQQLTMMVAITQRRLRERYLETLSSIALQLLSVTDWQGAAPAILADLCGVLGVDGGFIAQWESEDKTSPLTLLCHWTAGQERPLDGLEHFLRSCLNAQALSAMEQGQGLTFTASAGEQKAFPQGLAWQSLSLLPLFVESRLWGVLGFVQSRYKRCWHDTDFAVLRVASALLGSAIERQLAMERQIEQERQLRDLFENAIVGIYRSTPEGHFLMANQTLARINGYESVDELMALNIPEQIYADPEDRRRFQRLMEEQGFVADFRYPIKRKDGSIGWVAKWARAVRDATGQVRYYEGFVLDITEQVMLSQRLQGLQEIAHTLVARLDLESILTAATQELSRLYPDSALVLLQHLPERQGYLVAKANEAGEAWLQAMGQQVGRILPEHPFHALEQRLRRGESVTIDVSADGVLSGQGARLPFRAAFLKGLGTLSEFWGILMMLRRETDFCQHDLTFLNSFCDYLSIAIRNATLFQQLQRAYQELQAMQERVMEQERLRALGQMASGIAHDINNALVPIQGFAELLLEHDDPTVQNAAQVIFKAARDITTVIQRMREFYRPRTKEEPLEPLDLNALCQDALAMTRPRWHNIPQERGVVIEPRLELSENLPPVVGISNEVRQAIVNLILNASDAMPQGGTLTLRTYKAEREGRLWAVVEVSDTGIGMDEETRRRAIEPFFTTKGEGGSGLGLSVVYGTMQRHEGLLEIESEPGKGTTVRLWFPSKKAAMETATIGKVPPMRLLVIDDEPFVREMVASLLQRDGHWVVTAPDGDQGIAAFERALASGEPFDVVITDLGMPQKDGFAVARAIKALSPSTPVLLLSGWGFRLQGEEMRSLIDEVLTKPATHQQLRRALYNLWRRRHASEGNGD